MPCAGGRWHPSLDEHVHHGAYAAEAALVGLMGRRGYELVDAGRNGKQAVYLARAARNTGDYVDVLFRTRPGGGLRYLIFGKRHDS